MALMRRFLIVSGILLSALGFGVVGTQEVCAGCNGTHGVGQQTGTGAECYIAEGNLRNQLQDAVFAVERDACGFQEACNVQINYTSACYQQGDNWARDGYAEFGCSFSSH